MSSAQHVPVTSAQQSGDVQAIQASPASITAEDCGPVTTLQQPGLIQSPSTSSERLPGTSAQQSGDNETTARHTTVVMGN